LPLASQLNASPAKTGSKALEDKERGSELWIASLPLAKTGSKALEDKERGSELWIASHPLAKTIF